MRVALVHDYLVEYGGAERVLEALHEIWPEAPVFVAYFDPKGLGPHRKRFKNWDIRESWAKNLPFMPRLLSFYRIFAPLFFESFDFSDFDVVISSTNIYFAKGIVTKPETVHICYCHTPPRFLYGYPYATRWRNYPIIKQVSDILNHFLRIYDFLAAQRVDWFVANSKNTAARIRKFYRREAKVIYPPVETRKYAKLDAKKRENGDFFLFVSRLDYFKRPDLAVEACNRLKLPLKVVGKGPEEERIKKMAGPTVEVLGEVSDEKLAQLYRGCRALIYPAEEEDFGIVPVEAMAAGAPVIALRSGGVRESVVDPSSPEAAKGQRPTGIFFEKPRVEDLMKAIQRYKDTRIHKKDCIKQAERFSKARFKKEIKKFVEEKWQERRNLIKNPRCQ